MLTLVQRLPLVDLLSFYGSSDVLIGKVLLARALYLKGLSYSFVYFIFKKYTLFLGNVGMFLYWYYPRTVHA